MAEFEVAGNRYQCRRLDAFDQTHVARRIAPLIVSMAELAKVAAPTGSDLSGQTLMQHKFEDVSEVAKVFSPIITALAKMPDDDLNYVYEKCLSVTQRFDSGRWVPIRVGGRWQYQDINGGTLLMLTANVVMENLGDFLDALGSSFNTPAETQQPLNQ